MFCIGKSIPRNGICLLIVINETAVDEEKFLGYSDHGTMTNPFENLAEKQIAAPVKRKQAAMALRLSRSEKDAPQKLTALEKSQRDRGIQTSLWRAAHRHELELAHAGPHGEELRFLESELRRLRLRRWRRIWWRSSQASPLRQAPPDIRYLALAAIGNAILRLRISNGYAPFDDSLPGEEPTAFEIIRSLL